MTEPTEKETRWFVNRLLELRNEVDRYHSSFIFNLNDLKEWEEENGYELSQDELYDRVNFMIEEMKGYYIENNNNQLFAEGLKCKKVDEENIKIEGFTTKYLKEYENWINQSPENRISINSIPLEEIPIIKFKTKNNKIFILNPNDGSCELGDVKYIFGDQSREFKILYCLAKSAGIIVSYSIILSDIKLENNTSNKRELTQILKRIKQKLNILSEGRNHNPDIFKNSRNNGYFIIKQN